LWAISNIAAGNSTIIQKLIDYGDNYKILHLVIDVIEKSDNSGVIFEALIVLTNMTSSANDPQIVLLLDFGVLEIFISAIDEKDESKPE